MERVKLPLPALPEERPRRAGSEVGRSEKHLADQYGQERARKWGEGSQTDVERDTPRPRGAREEVGGGGRRREGESLQGTACAIQEYCYPPESVSAGTSHSAPSLGRGGEGRGGQDWGSGGPGGSGG